VESLSAASNCIPRVFSSEHSSPVACARRADALFANMGGKLLSKRRQGLRRHTARLRLTNNTRSEPCSTINSSTSGTNSENLSTAGKNYTFLRSKMNFDLLLEELSDLNLPGLQIVRRDGRRAIRCERTGLAPADAGGKAESDSCRGQHDLSRRHISRRWAKPRYRHTNGTGSIVSVTTGRSVSQSCELAPTPEINMPLASKKLRMRETFPSNDSSRIGASTARALVLSTVRFAICETCGDSETANGQTGRAHSAGA